MIMTYDFIFAALKNKNRMDKLREAVQSESDVEICTDIHRVHFDPHRKVVTVRPYSETSPFHYKVVPTEIKYQGFIKMLDSDWEHLEPGDIKYIDD